ncbi:MAG: hypothetical protein LBT97_04555, partial [Planctomycetota bacterium]|nr:hypothetical protein [Planctomycetota bacterium]
MARTKNAIPEAKKRYHHGSWEIFWRWGGRQYRVVAGVTGQANDKAAETIRRAISSCLAGDGAFAPPFDQAPGALRYQADRYGRREEARISADPSRWLEDYAGNIRGACSPRWADISLSYLRRLGDLAAVTPDKALKYLDRMAAKRASGTRNRALAACKRFYGWAAQTGRMPENPFAGISALPEEHAESIVYCTREERGRIVAAAIGLPRGLAIPVAFFAGMRREEIARMQWIDILHAEGRIVVPKTKTGRRRILPLASELQALLAGIPESARRGFVVDYSRESEAWVAEANALIEAIRCRLSRPLECKPDGTPAGTSRKKSFAMTGADLARPAPEHCPAMAADGLPWIPAERIRWNAFRHTFGSLLAQAGVSLDKIS